MGKDIGLGRVQEWLQMPELLNKLICLKVILYIIQNQICAGMKIVTLTWWMNGISKVILDKINACR
jgi:hypothetical protein